MTNPWIEIEEVQHRNALNIPGSSDYTWQAQFACRVNVLPHADWNRLKWGFNALALYDESIERQKVFLEAQYGAQPRSGMEPPDYRTLALRFVNRPGEALGVVILGKIHAKTKADGMESGLSYCCEVMSTCPYEYTLHPARSRQDFLEISGRDILDEDNGGLDMEDIRLSHSSDPVRHYPEPNAELAQKSKMDVTS